MSFDRPDTVLLEISEQEWAIWQHNPITAAFLQFQDDQIATWRELVVDLLEGGAFVPGDPREDKNLDVVRGKLIAMRGLRGITLEAIQGFYGKAQVVEAEEEDQA